MSQHRYDPKNCIHCQALDEEAKKIMQQHGAYRALILDGYTGEVLDEIQRELPPELAMMETNRCQIIN